MRYKVSTMNAIIGSLHNKAPETPARALRGQGLKGRLLNSTERRPLKCVRRKVHQRALRLKFLCLNMPCVALISRRKNQPLRLHLKLEEILHSTCRAPVVLGGVDIVYLEGRILNLVQYSKDSNSCLLRGCGMDE